MPVQFSLADDDHPCVFCGQVSAKGVVTQVGQHRFFVCADCMESVIPEFLNERLRHLIPFKGEPHHCVCCGKNSGTGIILQLKRNWSFTCEKCAKEVILAILGGWRGLNNIGKVRRRSSTNISLKGKAAVEKIKVITSEVEKIKAITSVQNQLVAIKEKERQREITRNSKIQVDKKSVDDIPPEERFWKGLPECPKCKAAVQPDWTEYPFCGHKLKKKSTSKSNN